MEPIIEVKNLGKKYNIAHMRGGYVALRDVIAGVARNPFSFLKHKAKQAVGLAKKEEFWALKGVNFTVNKGEVVGVIGANGAGKSTLLKVLSQITPPTEGEVVIRGRVGSLLEVGTGFHPELSGRENIFLNGAILGMKKREIEKKFDEIVAFAGIEKFLDTPVKHYSSGMYVRLAFSVAAHMEPDILLVDEVLAVGDAEFQKKCLGKMDEITKEEGRTILFVSHNLLAITSLCKKCIFIKNGHVEMIDETAKVIGAYLKSQKISNLETTSLKDRRKRGSGAVQFSEIRAVKNDKESWKFSQNEEVKFEFECIARKEVPNLSFYMALRDPETNKTITNFRSIIRENPLKERDGVSFSITIPANTLRPVRFALYFGLANSTRTEWYDFIDANVSLPILTITPASMDPNDTDGILSIPCLLKIS